MGILKKATLATVLAATAVTSVTPAMADPYYGRRRGGGDATGAAIAGGIIGLALGAIIASSANRNNRFADRGWTWRDGYYWDRQGHRYDRDGRPCDDDGYYDRRGYSDRGWNDRNWNDRGWNDRGWNDRGWNDRNYGNQGWSRDDRGAYRNDGPQGDPRWRYGN
ncbi:hypothetical protein H7F50_14440 [Novosphingobium flavum]|uniref:17 kDa surface antigen n=1 Tax=Novosphingobium aerophilum TaxID=2839843 RepID=A0A7X1F632_9SPHN|nr:hypothetical protein [Novosphingobium aerophilum]MBC2651087.1 hypothetical protein [Novosphingobium aerophilum]MBC2662953.1 hypothetical protein [Novosphingobium aerophilum]